ncbi:hypothetical protein COT75_01640 [Candidatus Beckwithbacteria bacterium CG10_big_fil_rev_8_21_14_0_10_34_10]|uniref:Glycosyl transferase family 1 domain-containing protein n=1 Tax=Candidatus Beckwithbacteria bacterium CG10_big_fil_rev_8_21_14_0_10_34_10 TaxID=1974495 RepID=A0A2H0W9L6_9BACT|nr:MAG: hypothetical protein COT75_01640 [Candidatus Beckwithbacteria bacterium CG10_big_fil_rev_8_21_14_0_10_34_10]
MRILFISDYFPPFAPGGAEWSSYYSAQGLAKKGEEVVVLTPNYGKNPKTEESKGFKIIRFPFPFKLKNKSQTLPYFLNSQPLYYLYFGFWIVYYSIREKVDLLHLQERFSLPAAVLAKYILRKPLVFTLRNFVLFCPVGTCLQKKSIKRESSSFSHFWNQCVPEYINLYLKPKSKIKYLYARASLLYSWIDNLMKRRLLKNCDKLIAISNSLREIYLKADLVCKDKIKVVYNLPPLGVKKTNNEEIIRLRKKHQLGNKKVVLYAGRLTLGKGVYDLLKAGEIVCQREKNVVFLLIGKGSLKVKTQSYFKIIPEVSHEELFKYYQLADLVVVPTAGIEPFGRVPIEAALFKKAVIITRSGGLKEQIIAGKTGFIVSRKNPSQLAEVILKLLRDKSLSLKIGENHYQFVKQKFNQKKITERIISIYQSLK